MAGITGIGTTFNLPNFHGELIAISPTDTPLLSAAGGVGGGKQTDSTSFEWQEKDLRAPGIRPRLEGADAPAAESRVRRNVDNVVQIFHESVSTSYTKQAATGQYSTPGTAPFQSNSGEPNPVGNEHASQVADALTTIALDVNYTFWHGKKVRPVDNATARETGGLLQAIKSNRIVPAEVVAAATATDTITSAANGLNNGDRVAFTTISAGGLRADRVYYVVETAAGTFKVSETLGGAAVVLGTGSVSYVKAGTAVSVDSINGLLQSVFDNGGITQGATATMFVPSTQKVKISKAYAEAYGKADPLAGRNVGGVAVDAIVTDFGTLNIVIDRALPADAVAVASVEQLNPVFLAIPGKGVLFEEELAKTGASEKTQIYGEIGFQWGNERAHGLLRGLSV